MKIKEWLIKIIKLLFKKTTNKELKYKQTKIDFKTKPNKEKRKGRNKNE